MNVITLDLPARLKLARKTAGFKTAKSFTDKHGFPASTYCQHETGARNFDDATIKEYSKILKVNYDWLAKGEGVPYKNKSDEARAKEFEFEMLDLNVVSKTLPLISEQLLFSILESLMSTNKKIIPKELSRSATIIYSEIVRMDGTIKEQLKTVEPAVKTFLRLAK
jgi:hypothetical protein